MTPVARCLDPVCVVSAPGATTESPTLPLAEARCQQPDSSRIGGGQLHKFRRDGNQGRRLLKF